MGSYERVLLFVTDDGSLFAPLLHALPAKSRDNAVTALTEQRSPPIKRSDVTDGRCVSSRRILFFFLVQQWWCIVGVARAMRRSPPETRTMEKCQDAQQRVINQIIY